ncbi:hypothetical protein HN51_054054 [Arachis hypogaea]
MYSHVCDEKDKNTLIMFKHGVIDPSGVLFLWSIRKKDCCQWRGVHCDNTTGKVTGLSLTCSQIYPIYGNDVYKLHCLTGELNISSLFELQFLSFLELDNNNFSIIHYHGQGGNSSNNLYYLDLSDNGNLKADHMLHWISNLSFLQYQDLTGINLQDETNWLQLVRLLPSISELYLEYCGLQNIYPSLQYANFTALNVLDLSNNDFVQAKLPNWIFNFSSGAISNWVGQNIIALQLRSKLFSRNIPTTMCKLDFLKIFDLSNNKLSRPISSFCGVSLFASRNVESVFVESVYPRLEMWGTMQF